MLKSISQAVYAWSVSVKFEGALLCFFSITFSSVLLVVFIHREDETWEKSGHTSLGLDISYIKMWKQKVNSFLISDSYGHGKSVCSFTTEKPIRAFLLIWICSFSMPCNRIFKASMRKRQLCGNFMLHLIMSSWFYFYSSVYTNLHKNSPFCR